MVRRISVCDFPHAYPSGISATTLREALKEFGEDREGPKFYQMMRRLEQNGLVESWQRQFDVGGGEVARTYYRATKPGRVAWKVTIEFYAIRTKLKERLLNYEMDESGGGEEIK